MKKVTLVLFAFVLLLPSMSCGWGSPVYPGRAPWQGYHGQGYGYARPYPYPVHDYDDGYNDGDAAILGAVLGTAAIIGTVLVVDAIRNQPAPEPTPPPAPGLNQ